MMPVVFRDKRGFTLIEVLISMMILLFGLLGSLAGVMAALDYNLGNAMRQEAARIAQEQLEVNRNMAIAAVVNNLDGTPVETDVPRVFRKSPRNFRVIRDVSVVGTVRQVTVTVQWTYKNRTRSYALNTILRQPG